MRVAIILNRTAGTLRSLDADATARHIADMFDSRGHQVETDVQSGAAAIEAIERHCRGGRCDVVVAGGGDGTISAAAGLAAETGVALGVLPLGTMNLFARSLGIPLELKAAAAALAGGAVERVDIGDVNGRSFVHHVTLGLHPRMIRLRERMTYSSRWGKIWSNVQAWLIVIRHPRRLAALIDADGVVIRKRTVAILVTNNPLGEGHLPYADTLRSGRLGLYVSTTRWISDLLRLTARMSLGKFAGNPHLDFRLAEAINITVKKNPLFVSLDGELVQVETPLRITVRTGGLNVLRPRGDGERASSGTGAMAA